MSKNYKRIEAVTDDQLIVETEDVANESLEEETDLKIKPDVPKRFKPSVTSLDEAYSNGFISSNKDGKCEKCGLATMYKERTLCYRCYITEKVK